MKLFRILGILCLLASSQVALCCELTCPPDENAQCDAIEAAIFMDFAGFEAAGGSAANCDFNLGSFMLLSQISNGATCPEFVTRTYQITDVNNDSYTCDHVIEVSDEENPVMICPPNQNTTCDISEQPAYSDYQELMADGGDAFDNCEIDVNTFQLVAQFSDGLTCPETVTRIYSLDDLCGNSVTCDHVVIINDDVNPIITCPPDIVEPALIDDLPPYSTDTSFTEEMGSIADNCGIDNSSFALESEIYNGSACPQYYIRTYQVEDLCSNISTCQQKLILCHSTDTLNISECVSYTSPSGKYFWNVSGTYQDTIPNAACCDSLLTIYLTIEDNIVEEGEDGLPNSLRMTLACAASNAVIQIESSVDSLEIGQPLIINNSVSIMGDLSNIPVIEFDFLNAELLNSLFGMKIESGNTLTLENIIILEQNNVNNADLILNEGALNISQSVKVK